MTLKRLKSTVQPPGDVPEEGSVAVVGLPKRLAVIAAACSLIAGVVAAPAVLASGSQQTYLIVYQSRAVPADAGTRISSAGGTLVARYDAIGVAVATSSSATFRASVKADSRIAEAAATGRSAVRLNDDQATDGTTTPANTPATTSDTLTPLQWDMIQIHTPEAHVITGGNSSVLVGDIDTGIDFNHPDLAPNVDIP
ncbi:MAG TPA: hypothetical protein VIM20_08020, partial [Candidatus Limnocylindrales bacterium]